MYLLSALFLACIMLPCGSGEVPLNSPTKATSSHTTADSVTIEGVPRHVVVGHSGRVSCELIGTDVHCLHLLTNEKHVVKDFGDFDLIFDDATGMGCLVAANETMEHGLMLLEDVFAKVVVQDTWGNLYWRTKNTDSVSFLYI